MSDHLMCEICPKRLSLACYECEIHNGPPARVCSHPDCEGCPNPKECPLVGEHITDLEAETRELREKYDGAVKECQRLTDENELLHVANEGGKAELAKLRRALAI